MDSFALDYEVIPFIWMHDCFSPTPFFRQLSKIYRTVGSDLSSCIYVTNRLIVSIFQTSICVANVLSFRFCVDFLWTALSM